MSRAVNLTIIGVCLLGAASVPIIIEDWRHEENRATAAAERAAQEVSAPQEWPTPPPIPRAKWTPDGFSYPAVEAEFDPCGSGPMRLVSTDEEPGGMSTVIPLWRRHWDDPAYALYLADLPPQGLLQTDSQPRWWRSFGPTDISEDPCGRPPMTALSDETGAA